MTTKQRWHLVYTEARRLYGTEPATRSRVACSRFRGDIWTPRDAHALSLRRAHHALDAYRHPEGDIYHSGQRARLDRARAMLALARSDRLRPDWPSLP
jgi:hypothetical protein